MNDKEKDKQNTYKNEQTDTTKLEQHPEYSDLFVDKETGKTYIRLTHNSFDTIQGEGRTQGLFTHLIRFARCNLRCNFCDINANWTANYLVEYDDLVQRAFGKNLLITGGEPMMTEDRQKLIAKLIHDTQPTFKHLIERGLHHITYKKSFTSPFTRHIDLETNGTNYAIPELIEAVSSFNISPKESYYQRYDLKEDIQTRPKLLEQIKYERWPSNKYIVKFVFNGKNADWILSFVELYEIPEQCVYIMPLGETRDQIEKLLPKAVDFAVKNGFNVSPRLHIIVYDGLILG